MQPPQNEDIKDQLAPLPPESTAENISAFADIYEEQIEEEGKERKLLLHLLQQDTDERKQLRLVLENLLKVMLQLQPSTPEIEPEKPKQEQSSLESQIEKLQNELAKANQEKEQLQLLINNLETSLTSQTNTIPRDQYAAKTDTRASNVDINITLTREETTLVSLYEKQTKQLLPYATEVSATEESIGERLSGNNQAAVLEKSRKGNYWIINVQDVKYLVPQKDNLKINTFNYETVEALFECIGYEAGYSSDFKLIKPGKVRSISTGDKWELVERGVLKFS
ncbi:hypothetical protein [Limnofasciculus baicalensis]|uniref:Uncharacterized protein n=1 Tax=Limnofasciculus baicalensis BBK-W-15 TaxID=2699891 RepID=A0AAE3GT54_9CYAN|nr:hypothetical protein [Limnofasciculus baicalensis]MCP2728047.1 hypothetical protein [Limnofasciculus baicalensis BBK-W-15]